LTHAEYLSWLCLKTAPELGPKLALEVLKHYPDPTEFTGKPRHPLYQGEMLTEAATKHLQENNLPHNTDAILKLMDHYQIECLNINEYPVRLKDIFAPPLLLYFRGNKDCLFKAKNLAVVGTRKSSSYGRAMCSKLLAPLCRQKVNIVSGLALGIDTFAHKIALQEGCSTVAVLAGGLDAVYPPQNAELAKQILASGALISEYEPGTKSEKWNFPARNRIISALAEVVFVVEGPISSGALLTAKNGIQQDREICALPGNINNINAEGPNHLIKNGAALISSTEDLMNILGMNPEKAEQLEIPGILSKDEQVIYELLKNEQRALSFDEILIITKFPIGRLSTLMTNLELKGVIEKEGGNSFFAL
jgi:DNA processing protein